MSWDRTGLRPLLTSLPKEAFLRRDRGNALYVTDAPRFGWTDPGPAFSVEVKNGLAYLTPMPFLMERAEGEPDELARTLQRFGGSCEETLPRFVEAVKLLEAPEKTAFRVCDKNLRRHAALALRGAADGRGLYGCALVLAAAERELKVRRQHVSLRNSRVQGKR